MTNVDISYAPAAKTVREQLRPYTKWMEEILGVPQSETLTLEMKTPLDEAVVAQVLRDVPLTTSQQNAAKLYLPVVQRWELPPDTSPHIAVTPVKDPLSRSTKSWSVDWKECPIAVWLKDTPSPFLVANIPHVSSGHYETEEWKRWLIVARTSVASVLQALRPICCTRTGEIEVTGGSDQVLDHDCGRWDELVLAPEVQRLVRRDFESFFAREEWFRRHRLPYKRGYLFFGPPGNGKTSVIRAMANHPGLSLFSINFNNELVDDSDVALMFAKARNSAPALIVLEDLDRIFPREGLIQKVKVSLSGLLNGLDGVTVQQGLIVAATANDPAQLDPAILNRPGRFDRVIEFRNPAPDVRARYFQKIVGLNEADAMEMAEPTDGFSFAQIKETYILAGQFAFEEERDITISDLRQAAQTMRKQSLIARSMHGSKVGFSTR
ncbi:MAG: AAA family ATPase [Acidobacteriaceae bacterium]|nr:AAA family ATPase [Acidobacteriaceae bacterium]